MTTPIISFSVEKGFRYFKENISFFHFFMIQLQINKKEVVDGDYIFSLKKNNNSLYSKHIKIDSLNNRIITHYSHEDPLVQNEFDYFICFQIDSEKIINFNDDLTLVFYSVDKNNEIYSSPIESLAPIYQKYKTNHYSSITENNQIVSRKDCSFTLHLGDTNGNYSEESFYLVSEQLFDFSEYIKKYSYVGLQCSYECENPEIEEKHIIIGQKGIFLSGFINVEKKLIDSILPFDKKYQKEHNINDFKKINSIKELIEYYQDKKEHPKFFESNLFFLLPQYEKVLTYNQDGLYSTNDLSKKNHFFLDNCKNCSKNFKCIQIVPSGLSNELLKNNIALDSEQNCLIYNLIN